MSGTSSNIMVVAKLQQECQRRDEQQDSVSALAAKKNKKFVCFRCKKPGHCIKDCPRKSSSSGKDNALLTALSVKVKSDVWYVDSGATSHMCNDRSIMNNFTQGQELEINVANGEKIFTTGYGNVKVTLNNCVKTISEVYHVPGLSTNLLSVSAMAKKGYVILFDANGCKVYDKDTIVATASHVNGVYQLDSVTPCNKTKSRKKAGNCAVCLQTKDKVLHDDLVQVTAEQPRAESLQLTLAATSGKTTATPGSSVRRVPVPDDRFDYLCEFHKPASKVPAFLNVVDIAGLVRGAAEGQGLGNAFLSHIKACDAIFNLCRAFDDEDVIHVDGEVDPVRDLETIGEELRLKDEEQLVQNFEKLDKLVNRGGDKKLKAEYDAMTKIKAILVDEKKHIRFGDWSAADIEVMNKYLFLTSKPALYLVNLSEKDYIRKKNKWLPKLKEWIDKNDPGAPLIPFSGALETKLIEMDAAERQAFLKEHNLTSALDKIIVQGYKALQLEYFFTAGPDEVKAWTIQKGTKAPQAAGRIHTDFEKGFIMAEVMHYKDFKEEGTEAACKAAGKYRQQGRNYVVEDGDVIFFKFNAGAGIKDAKKK